MNYNIIKIILGIIKFLYIIIVNYLITKCLGNAYENVRKGKCSNIMDGEEASGRHWSGAKCGRCKGIEHCTERIACINFQELGAF